MVKTSTFGDYGNYYIDDIFMSVFHRKYIFDLEHLLQHIVKFVIDMI